MKNKKKKYHHYPSGSNANIYTQTLNELNKLISSGIGMPIGTGTALGQAIGSSMPPKTLYGLPTQTYPVSYSTQQTTMIFNDVMDIMKLPKGETLSPQNIEAARKIIYGYDENRLSLFWNFEIGPLHHTKKKCILLKSTIDFMTNIKALKTIYNAALQREVNCIPYPIKTHVLADLEPTDFTWIESKNVWVLDNSQFTAEIINT